MNHNSKGGKADSKGDSESNSTRDEQSKAAVFPLPIPILSNIQRSKYLRFLFHLLFHFSSISCIVFGIAVSFLHENAQGSSDVTLEDMYNNNYEFEDDSDWEPSSQAQDVFEITKWFCVNCTIDNFGKGVHCEFCGEHRQSGIIKYGFLASPLSEEGQNVNEADATVRLKG